MLAFRPEHGSADFLTRSMDREDDDMADKIFGAAGCNKSELKLVKRQPATATTAATGSDTVTRPTR